MKAITITQPFATLVAYGEKTIEYRTWQTDYRGPLIICAGRKIVADDDLVFPHGVAVAVAHLVGIEPFGPQHIAGACLDATPAAGGYAWLLRGAREIVPFAVAGKQRLFSVEQSPELIDDLSDLDHIDLFHQVPWHAGERGK